MSNIASARSAKPGDKSNKGKFGGDLKSVYGMMAWRCGKCSDFMPGTRVRGSQQW